MSDNLTSLHYWTEANNHAVEHWTQRSAGVMQGAADLAQEIMTFSQSRFQAGIDAWKELLTCRSPDDFFKCQERFLEKAAGEYLDEVGKLTSQMVGLIALSREEQATLVPGAAALPAPGGDERRGDRRRVRGRSASQEETAAR